MSVCQRLCLCQQGVGPSNQATHLRSGRRTTASTKFRSLKSGYHLGRSGVTHSRHVDELVLELGIGTIVRRVALQCSS